MYTINEDGTVTRKDCPSPQNDNSGCLIILLVITCIVILLMIFKCSYSSNDGIRNVSNARIEITLGKCYYTGPINKNGLPNGRGEARFDDGRLYRGEFKQGVAEGKDAYFKSKEGNVFEGTFQDNRYIDGKYTSEKGGWYFLGTYKNGEPYAGTLYSLDGKKVIKRIKEGKLCDI